MSIVVRRATAMVACLGVVLAGCGRGSDPGNPKPGDLTWSGSPGETSATWSTDLDPDSQYGLHKRKGLETVVKPETKVLSTADTAAITSVSIDNESTCLSDADTHPMCEFSIDFSRVPDDVRVGSVLNSGITETTPQGLLVKVTAIDGHTVKGVQATLQDAISQGEFWAEHTFTPDQVSGEPTLAEGVTLARRTPAGGTKGSAVAALPRFDVSLPGALEIDIEPVDGVHLTGSLDFGAGCGLDGGVGGSDVAWVEVSCHAWEEAGLSIRATGAGPRSTERYFVADIPFVGFPVPIGPIVVVVIVDLLITVDLSGTVHADLHYGASERADVYGSLRYSIRHGLDHDGGVKVGGLATKTGVQADASVTAVGRAELRLSAYGVLGFSVGADASVILTGGPTRTPRWRVSGNAGISASIFLGIIGYELRAWIAYHLKSPFTIKDYTNSPPELTVTWPTPGAVIVKGGLVPPKVDATAKDEEDGILPVTWTDSTDHVTVSGTTPQTLPFTALGTHTLTVSATDSEGRTTTRTIHVQVEPPTSGLSLTLRTIDGKVTATVPTATSGDTLLVDAVITSSAISAPSCSALVWSATNATVDPGTSCRARLTLTNTGTATVTARLPDGYGTTTSAARSVTVVAPSPGPVTPTFEGIDATHLGRHLVSGETLTSGSTVQLEARYLNYDAAKVKPVYQWSYRVGTAAPVAMNLPPGWGELLNSVRSYTPPTSNATTVRFFLAIRNADTGAMLTQRSFTISWQMAPK
jgi:hypothetical protein